MPGRKPVRPRSVERVVSTSVDDPETSRALDELAAAMGKLQERPTSQVITDVDLVIGTNVVRHGLGRAPKFVDVMPTVLDASFAWRHDTNQPHLDRQVLIEISGVAQPNAAVRVE